jgi:hypothetical protein
LDPAELYYCVWDKLLDFYLDEEEDPGDPTRVYAAVKRATTSASLVLLQFHQSNAGSKSLVFGGEYGTGVARVRGVRPGEREVDREAENGEPPDDPDTG